MSEFFLDVLSLGRRVSSIVMFSLLGDRVLSIHFVKVSVCVRSWIGLGLVFP